MRATEFITEAFDKPYAYNWQRGDHGDYDILVKLPDGSPLNISFNHEGDDVWHVAFDRGHSQEITGEGDAQRIFATVLHSIKQFIGKQHPEKLYFSASKQVEPGQRSESRANLYSRMIKRYASSMGYDSVTDDFGRDSVTYILNKKQGVTEDTENSMSTEDMIAYLRQHHDSNLHQDYINHLNTFSKFVLRDIPVNTIKTELPGLDKAKVEQYKKMDFSKAPPIVMGNGHILDGYHRTTVAKALGIPTIKGYVGIKHQGVAEGSENNGISFKVQKGKNKFATTLSVGVNPVGVYQYDADTGRSVAEVYPEFKGKGLGKLLVLHAIYTAAKLGLDFQEDESRTSEYDNVLDSLSSNGYIVDDDGYWYVTGEGEQYLQQALKQDVAEGSLNEIYKMPPTKDSSQGMAIWAYNDAVEKKSPVFYRDNNVIIFKFNEYLLRYIILQDGNPVLYIGLSRFLDGYKSGTVATEIEGRGKGLAQKAYLNASDILGVPIYSDTTQTDASRLGIWDKLIQQYPDRIVGYDQKTNKDLPLSMSDKGPIVNQNQPIYVNNKDTNKPIAPNQRYRTRILKLLPIKQGVAEGRENYNGINLLLQRDDDEVFVKASAGGRELGHVLFVDEGDYLMPQDLEVDERFQGQGIAQTMYDYVKSKGYKIRRSGQQTAAGAGFWDKHRPEQNVWEGTADDINKMFNNMYDPLTTNLQRVALMAMQGRQDEAGMQLNRVIKDASPEAQKKIIDAVNNIKPVTINGKVADSSTLDKSHTHQDWILNTFIPWVKKTIGHQDVTEDATPTMGINVRSDGDIDYASLIIDGKKKYESRQTDSLRPYVGKTVAIVRTGKGPAVAIGQVTVGDPIVVDAEKFDKMRKQHLVPQGSKFDIGIDATKYLYPMINPVRWDNEKLVKQKGIVARKID